MPRKKTGRNKKSRAPIVEFNLNDRVYQIDPDRQKVYQRFVEIETSRAFEIYSTWRSQTAQG